MSDFGIVVPCFSGDADLLSGCLESVKCYYPGVPICLIPHGAVNVCYFTRRYGCSYIDSSTIHPALRARSYGYGLTKMIAFWHSPFESFLHIDADTICWGRFFEPDWLNNLDLLVNAPHETVTDNLLREQYFDCDLLPEKWKPRILERRLLFNSGTFGSRRGLLSLSEYCEILDIMDANPKAIFLDQGILNLIVQNKVSSNQLRFAQRTLQAVVAVLPEIELKSRFRIEYNSPVVINADKVLIHWAGHKPLNRMIRRSSFSAPMDYFRLRHLGLQRVYDRSWGIFIADAFGSSLVNSARISNRLSRLAKRFNRPHQHF